MWTKRRRKKYGRDWPAMVVRPSRNTLEVRQKPPRVWFATFNVSRRTQWMDDLPNLANVRCFGSGSETAYFLKNNLPKLVRTSNCVYKYAHWKVLPERSCLTFQRNMRNTSGAASNKGNGFVSRKTRSPTS